MATMYIMDATNKNAVKDYRPSIPLDLYERARKAAAWESVRRGRTVSVSEWIRQAVAQQLAEEEEERSG